MPRKLTRRAARAMSAKRLTHGAGTGRPRIDAPRCACAIMTLARAQTRGKSSDHDPSCEWYKERAIVI